MTHRLFDLTLGGYPESLGDELFKHVTVTNNLPSSDDLLREINRGGWSTGYTGQSPERLKLHRDNQKDFDLVTMRASSGPCEGESNGLPWPCWGTPELKHPGTHILYDITNGLNAGTIIPSPTK